ncbi:hypothetical protein UFOVP970_40 [uncultured Caudovirales phage]|uniref:Uncharacterized protein n=2 Tax=uncultured Caudovirales phage TaxID=2100421 RepID=A0A6J5PYY3_9CAUD|nr:hypothetical protein UFOVP970_40 [uncultured Caudovirales phage]
MNKERYNQIIDEVYKNYLKNGQQQADRNKENQTFLPLPKNWFIDKIKTDSEFSEKWGLKIEERELSLEERKKLYEGEFTPGIEVTNDHWLNSKLITRNIPTKLITITYNNETVEIYE